MPELLSEYAVAGCRRMTAAAVCALALCAIPAGAWAAQSVPAGLRACAADSDPGQRLDCYDREMKRLMAPASQAAPPARPAPPAQAAPPAAAPAPAPQAAPASAAPEAPSSSGARAPEAAVLTPARPETVKPVREPATAHRAGVWKLFSGGGPSRVQARIARVDRSPGALVLHLDNGQVWRQTGRASGGLGLRTGDEVTIEKHLGSYWLSSSHVADMRVRRESR